MKIKVKKEIFEGKEIDRTHLLKIDEVSTFVAENRSLIRRLNLYASPSPA